MRLHLYKARAFVFAGLVVVASVAQADIVGGVQLPVGVQKVGEDRYRSPNDYDGTLKYFRTVYPPEKYPRRSIVHQPGIKAFHISNPSGKNFEGLNIYEANDEVRIFIVRPAKKR